MMRRAISPPALWVAALVFATTATTAFANDPPEVDPIPVYRTYPGYPISIAIPASDPDAGGVGGNLSFFSDMLPSGSTLDGLDGIFEWTPHESQFGAYVIPVTVSDDGDPALETPSEIPIQVVPLDMCTVPTCDSATGCENVLLPLDQACCVGAPEIRVPDPEASCESGPAFHLGRNLLSFGRLHTCDILPIQVAQTGLRISLHFESRCLDTSTVMLIDERLEAFFTDSDGLEQSLLLYDSSRFLQLFDQEDGWARRLAQSRGIASPPIPGDLEGADALLTVTATDNQGMGQSITEEIRLTLSFIEPPPLPDPGDGTIPPPSDEAACEGCHRPLTGGPDDEREGIEDVHPWLYIACVDCHGGDDSAITVETAHVPPGTSPDFIKNLTSDDLDAVDAAYLRFINPGDLRVADQTCGLAGCHPEHVANAPLSVMSTYASHYTLPRYLVGSQDRTATRAAIDVIDPNFDAQTSPEGAVEAFTALREIDPLDDRSTLSSVMDTYLPKACPTCHLNDFGENKSPGTYRSSGCSACHMVYANDGLSQSEDPVIEKNFAPHPIKHQLTSAIPVEQCGHCHFQGGRVGLSYRGIREGGFPPELTPEHGTTLGESLYGHGPDFYFSDEDDTNAEDETPPDLHFDAGMACVDCHVGGDVHGDGNLYRSERYQTGIRCEDCHGTVRAAIEEDPGDGFFKNSKGDSLKRLTRTGPIIQLELAMDSGTSLYVPQIYDLIQANINPRMTEAMGVDEEGFSHTDSLECYACHTSWRPTCFGCHITVDDSQSALNHTTGLVSQGLTSATRDDYSLDFFALGINERGKLAPLCNSMSVFLSYVDEDGVLQYSDVPRTSHDGKKGFGWNPFHHHTVSKIPVPCAQCHPAEEGQPDNSDILDTTYGFGNGSVMVTDSDGVDHDLTQFLYANGDLMSDFPHPNTGPVPAAMRERALAVPEPTAFLMSAAALGALAGLTLGARRSRRSRSSHSER